MNVLQHLLSKIRRAPGSKQKKKKKGVKK